MGMIKEFKEFALRGNVVDMAVGIIIGAAFGKIVTSIVEDLIMPVIGKLVRNVDFTNLYLPLSDPVSTAKATAEAAGGALALAEAKKIGAVFAYGNFITILLNFVILAFCIFVLVKAMNTLKKREQAQSAPATTRECPMCASTISVKAKKCPACTSQLA
jgi:large conductance mechanosensitive channel